MLARLQQWITITLLATAAVWAMACTAAGHAAWAAIGALLIVFGYALFLAVEFVLLRAVQTADAAPLPRTGELLRAWWGEVTTAPRVFCWRQPFRSTAVPDWLPGQATGAQGVVLVHGFFCNRGFWNPWMRALRARGVPHVAPDLEPLFGSIDAYADRIEAAVAQIEACTGRPAVLIGHSMGGVAIRAWHARHGRVGRMQRAVTIGSPHHGTWMARFSRSTNGREMSLAHPWLAQLARTESAELLARFVCFYGNCDNIVFPSAVAILPGARNLHVPATAHVQLAFEPVVFETVCRLLDGRDEAPPAQ